MQLSHISRFRAAFIHLLISLVIFIVLLFLVFTVWYPGILSQVDFGWHQALILIAGVDLVLGPLLTLIIFNPLKKSLGFDLTVIAAVQIFAMTAGIYTVHTTRPVGLYVTVAPFGFQTLYADHLSKETLEKIRRSRDQLFYYQPEKDKSPLGPSRNEELRPDELIPVSSGHLYDALLKNARSDMFEDSDGTLLLGMADFSGIQIRLNRQGEVLDIVSPSLEK